MPTTLVRYAIFLDLENYDGETLADINTGLAWKRLLESDDGRLTHDSRNQVIGLCMDGANPFKKENAIYSHTPIMAQMFNLPFHLRKKIENMLLIGIVTGPRAPKSFQPYLKWYRSLFVTL